MQEMKKLKAAKHEIEEKIKSISVKEDVDALVEGEDLSEDFKESRLQSSKRSSPRHAMKSPVCIRQPLKSLMKNLS